ncbi:MAG: trigger factor [Patescibacteria group bacterium]
MTTLTKGENSTVTIAGEIAPELFEKQRGKAVRHIAASIHIDGFRPGEAPEKVLIQKFGEGALLEEMAHRALERAYPEIIEEHGIEALGRPEISITKLEKGAPVLFTIKTAVMPEVVLPDYKKIAKESLAANTETALASEKEVEDVVAEIKKLRTKEGEAAPELTDEFVKTLGKFESVADFKEKIGKNISLEKEIKLRDKKRTAILEGILEKSTSELPAILVDTELERMVSQMKADIVRAGGTFPGYVESTGKTEEDIRREMREAAEKRVRFELILKQIGKKEKLEASPEEVEKETAEVMAQYQGADPERAQLYVEGMLLNEKVLQFLESQK